ncbi:hypothetical protein HMPREF9374_1901 [Desmospora sp. 8437]|nr:hypothetical protein HMPREF9374_1901 [Desmospora sp. 8437]
MGPAMDPVFVPGSDLCPRQSTWSRWDLGNTGSIQESMFGSGKQRQEGRQSVPPFCCSHNQKNARLRAVMREAGYKYVEKSPK